VRIVLPSPVRSSCGSLVVTLLATLLPALPAAEVRAQASQAQTARVSYVASEGVYIDAGSAVGLRAGDTLAVLRAGQTVAHVVIGHTSTRSAASTQVESGIVIKVGDEVLVPSSVTARVQPVDTGAPLVDTIEATGAVRPPRTRNVFEGDISFQFYGRRDLTGSDASWIQPGLRTHLEMHNINGWNAHLLFRHRTRYYRRTSPPASGQSADEWSNRVFEFALVSGARDGGSQWGIGRVLVNDVRGMGYIDGGFYLLHLSRRFRTGVAFGWSPDPQTSRMDPDSKKAGLFVAYDMGELASHRLVLSGALSTQYEGSTVSRDFLYLQGVYSYGSRLSFYQSAEVDYNRDWRYEETGERLSLSNVYSMLTASLGRGFGLDVSYDSRQNYRYAETRYVPDSLFDSDTHRGWRAGVRVSPWSRLFLRADAGIRLRETDSVESRFVSFSSRISRFPWSRHSVWLGLSIVEAGLTTGYRPVLSYRLPVARGFFLNASGGVYIYTSANVTTSNSYLEASTTKSVGTRYFFSGSFRQYLDEQLKSSELYFELGLRI
jgi:hypothetical protein